MPKQNHEPPSVLQNNLGILNISDNPKFPIKSHSTHEQSLPMPAPANSIRNTLEVNFTKLHSICNKIARDHSFVKDVGNLAILLAANNTDQLEKIPPFFPTEILYTKAEAHLKNLSQEELDAAPPKNRADKKQQQKRTTYMMNHHAKFLLTEKSSTPNSAVTEEKIQQVKGDLNKLKKLVSLITAERIREGLLERISTYAANHPELSNINGNGWPVVMQHCKNFPHLTEFVVGTFKEKLFSSNVLSGPYSAYGLSTEIVKAANIIWQEEDSHHINVSADFSHVIIVLSHCRLVYPHTHRHNHKYLP